MSTSLPSTIAYAVPTVSELPEGVVDWTSAPATSALLIHDMQEHFLRPFAAGEEPLSTALANIVALRQRASALGIPVFYTAQPAHQAPEERALLTDFWGPGIGANEAGARIVAELAPDQNDTVLTKWRYSAFQRTDLAERLAALGRTQLVVTGVYAHIGCSVTASDAFMGDVQPFLVADAVADFSLAHHADALRWVAGRCGVVTTTAELLAGWDAEAGAEARVSETGRGADRDTETERITRLVRTEVATLLFLGEDEIGGDSDLVDLGLDSVRVMQLVETLRAAGLPASFDRLAAESTINDLARSLAGEAVGSRG